MKAREIMTCHAISIGPDLPVQAVARTLFANGISAVPVVGHDGKLLGIVSEGDLLHRVETGTSQRRSWWLELLMGGRTLANEFVKSHGLNARDVMTSEVITASPDTSLPDIALLMERYGIKRVPIVDKGQVIGIVSRANMIQAIASGASEVRADSDELLREQIVSALKGKPWGHGMVNVIVTDGKVDLWGFVDSEEEKNAIRVVAERTAQGGHVTNNVRVHPLSFAS